MNSQTQEIMALLKITDAALAERVIDEMHQHIRFSECSRREFNLEARMALTTVRWLDSFKGDREAMKRALDNLPVSP